MRTLGLVAVAALTGAVAATGIGYAMAAGQAGGADPGGPSATQLATAAIERTTLVAETELGATLGYPGSGTIRGGRPGVVTSLPREGAILEQGDVVVETDGNQRTILLDGRRPAWRTMRRGTGGSDVAQLERALAALGFLPRDVRPDGFFGDRTRTAVRAWQKKAGLKPDGIVDLGEVLFAQGSIRVSHLLASVGESIGPSSPIAEVTSGARVVAMNLPAERQTLLTTGDHVLVELPDGTRTPGTVSEIGNVAAAEGGDGPTLPVKIALDDPAAIGTLDGAPVTVIVTLERREDVLAAPVDALLALREGGYAVEVADPDGETHLVGVELGLFADGLVQVTGAVEAGDSVVVPR